MARAKLPSNIGNEVFSDSPIRSTEPKRVALVTTAPPLDPPEPPGPPRPPVMTASVMPPGPPSLPPSLPPPLPVIEPLPDTPVNDIGMLATTVPPPGLPPPHEPPSKALGRLPEQIKITVYLSKSQIDAIEGEVYRRRRTGERIGNTDLVREIVDYWRTGRGV